MGRLVDLDLIAKLVDLAAVAFGGAAVAESVRAKGFALFRDLGTLEFALVGLPIEGLGDSGGAAHVTEQQHFDLKFAAFVLDAEAVANLYLMRWFRRLSIRFDASEVTGFDGEGARLEESGRPQPLIYSYAGHSSIFVRAGLLRAQRFDGIDEGGTARGDETGDDGGDSEHSRHREESLNIPGTDTKQ